MTRHAYVHPCIHTYRPFSLSPLAPIGEGKYTAPKHYAFNDSNSNKNTKGFYQFHYIQTQ